MPAVTRLSAPLNSCVAAVCRREDVSADDVCQTAVPSPRALRGQDLTRAKDEQPPPQPPSTLALRNRVCGAGTTPLLALRHSILQPTLPHPRSQPLPRPRLCLAPRPLSLAPPPSDAANAKRSFDDATRIGGDTPSGHEVFRGAIPLRLPRRDASLEVVGEERSLRRSFSESSNPSTAANRASAFLRRSLTSPESNLGKGQSASSPATPSAELWRVEALLRGVDFRFVQTSVQTVGHPFSFACPVSSQRGQGLESREAEEGDAELCSCEARRGRGRHKVRVQPHQQQDHDGLALDAQRWEGSSEQREEDSVDGKGLAEDASAAQAKARLVTCLKKFQEKSGEGFPAQLRGRIWRALLGVEGVSSEAEKGLARFFERTPLNEANQRVIRSDVERTRASLEFFRRPETRQLMERLLTYYCKTREIKYKQGLNELLAPFIFLWGGDLLSLSDAYACFCEFLDRFLLRLFSDDEFTALQWSFLKFKLLLLFHDPALATFLEEQHVTPELYVTPWFLTLFASKVELGVLLALWDKYILEDDASFFCFLALALLIFNRSRILKTEVSQLPETLCRLSIHSTEQLDFVGVSLLPHCAPRSSVADRGREAGDLRLLFCPQTWRLARVLKAQTPPSLVREIAEAKAGAVSLRQLETETVFYISAAEVVDRCYAAPRHLATSEERRRGTSASAEFGLGISASAFGSDQGKVGEPKLEESFCLKPLLLDLRSASAFEAGRLPPAIHVDLSRSSWKEEVASLAGVFSAAAGGGAGCLRRQTGGRGSSCFLIGDAAGLCSPGEEAEALRVRPRAGTADSAVLAEGRLAGSRATSASSAASPSWGLGTGRNALPRPRGSRLLRPFNKWRANGNALSPGGAGGAEPESEEAFFGGAGESGSSPTPCVLTLKLPVEMPTESTGLASPLSPETRLDESSRGDEAALSDAPPLHSLCPDAAVQEDAAESASLATLLHDRRSSRDAEWSREAYAHCLEKFSRLGFTAHENAASFLTDRLQAPSHFVCLLADDEESEEGALAVYEALTAQMAVRWVSVVRGGFAACHRLARDRSLDLVDHLETQCLFCRQQNTRQQLPDSKESALEPPLPFKESRLSEGRRRRRFHRKSQTQTSSKPQPQTPSASAARVAGTWVGGGEEFFASEKHSAPQEALSANAVLPLREQVNVDAVCCASSGGDDGRESPLVDLSSSAGKSPLSPDASTAALPHQTAATPVPSHQRSTHGSEAESSRRLSAAGGTSPMLRLSGFLGALRRLSSSAKSPRHFSGSSAAEAEEGSGEKETADSPATPAREPRGSEEESSPASEGVGECTSRVCDETPQSTDSPPPRGAAESDAEESSNNNCNNNNNNPTTTSTNNGALQKVPPETAQTPRLVRVRQYPEGSAPSSLGTDSLRRAGSSGGGLFLTSHNVVLRRLSSAWLEAASPFLRVFRCRIEAIQQPTPAKLERALRASLGEGGGKALLLPGWEWRSTATEWNLPDEGPCRLLVSNTRILLVDDADNARRLCDSRSSRSPSCACTACLSLASLSERLDILEGEEAAAFAGLSSSVGRHVSTSPGREEEAAATSSSSRKSFVQVYSSVQVADTHKISSKKSDDRLLCFYFDASTNAPLMILRFPSALEARSCISSIRSVYRAFKLSQDPRRLREKTKPTRLKETAGAEDEDASTR